MEKPTEEMSNKEFCDMVRGELAWLDRHDLEMKHFISLITQREEEEEKKCESDAT